MAALDELRQGDTLIVTKLDRLARSMRDLMAVVDTIEKGGASLRIIASQSPAIVRHWPAAKSPS